MLIANPRATRAPYPDALKRILSIEKAEQSRAWLACWDKIAPAPTPLRTLPALAAASGIASLSVKDESARSVLGSFKALGAPIALVRLILRLWPAHDLDPRALFDGRYRALLAGFTVVSATDGNHGKGLAAAAQTLGCRCVIVLHANVSIEREQAIAAYGAQIVRIEGNYDASVEEAARLASLNGWHVVSDTSYDGYEDIPRDVMQGYGTVAAEIVEQSDARPDRPAYTHVLLQGGVGGLAAGIVSYLWEFHGAHRPRFVVVEPQQADCLYQSALAGKPSRATGSVDSVMAGLACGETSPLAWRFLQPAVDDFMTIADADAIDAMRVLATGRDGDVPIVAGESGAAGLAGLAVLLKDRAQATRVGLDRDSRVLVVNTEGATAPDTYRELVGETADAVLARQAAWAAGAASRAATHV
ncbi:PLP-dependent lyase/thiolase [Burkholderia multivorans]|uniref:diaminopropionate ammonia-lyase n=1 Tax=Burkholderia multivorans TaxID=87883 RepID=UPI00075DE323|nr:diaminopropionate ammonia-lyase [Burkholderia multivorans]KVV35183.1 PLP-dependent lyase/thiolase [Burkholderia multivorans]MBU9201036.1 diaminopropionate ammonia-lyase [Burkholderia multivorans]MCA8384606.1 diaminopropionate ammonia-lyase [Burkholderia multivorans]MCO8319576.1 diaminopropionate ammonia-lyase [Burkholderia multivorans]MCO8351543.1 diaminopropionate ammonia-lyase [Burkholderia multivorans]